MLLEKQFNNTLVRIILDEHPKYRVGMVLKDMGRCLSLSNIQAIKDRIHPEYINYRLISDNDHTTRYIIVYDNGINQILYKRVDYDSIKFSEWFYCDILPSLDYIYDKYSLPVKLNNTLDKLNYLLNYW